MFTSFINLVKISSHGRVLLELISEITSVVSNFVRHYWSGVANYFGPSMHTVTIFKIFRSLKCLLFYSVVNFKWWAGIAYNKSFCSVQIPAQKPGYQIPDSNHRILLNNVLHNYGQINYRCYRNNTSDLSFQPTINQTSKVKYMFGLYRIVPENYMYRQVFNEMNELEFNIFFLSIFVMWRKFYCL